jgi:hypothetical protein
MMASGKEISMLPGEIENRYLIRTDLIDVFVRKFGC